MIKSIKVESKHDDVRVANAVKVDYDEEYDYLLEFTPNKSFINSGNNHVLGKTILRHQKNSQLLISYDFKLKRGLYDVTATIVESTNGTEINLVEGTSEKYKEPVMVGGKYKLYVKILPAVCYESAGIKIQIISDEIQLDSKTMYYTILRDDLKSIRYYIPFNDTKKIDFFIKGITAEEFSLNITNPSFEIIWQH